MIDESHDGATGSFSGYWILVAPHGILGYVFRHVKMRRAQRCPSCSPYPHSR